MLNKFQKVYQRIMSKSLINENVNQLPEEFYEAYIIDNKGQTLFFVIDSNNYDYQLVQKNKMDGGTTVFKSIKQLTSAINSALTVDQEDGCDSDLLYFLRNENIKELEFHIIKYTITHEEVNTFKKII